MNSSSSNVWSSATWFFLQINCWFTTRTGCKAHPPKKPRLNYVVFAAENAKQEMLPSLNYHNLLQTFSLFFLETSILFFKMQEKVGGKCRWCKDRTWDVFLTHSRSLQGLLAPKEGALAAAVRLANPSWSLTPLLHIQKTQGVEEDN